jgi:hypothetical protein
LEDDIVKIGLLAEEMGISYKTLYVWINDCRLELKKPGFVSRSEAWEVLDYMRLKKSEISYFTSTYGINRDSYGRFIKDNLVESE